jgi:magnesium chelatase family protein
VPATAHTFAILGVEAHSVRAEADVRAGLPSFALVGLPDAAVRESRERVNAAIANSGFKFPQTRITVNLAPASLPKAGPGFDLAIAAAVLAASGQLPREMLDRTALAGELALDGTLRPAPGALAMAERARRAGIGRIAVPLDSAPEAALANLVSGNGDGPLQPIQVLGIDCLRSLGTLGTLEEPREVSAPSLPDADDDAGLPDLAELRGQPGLRRGLEVAAAGGHSILMVGPPGAGKSMAASRLPSILPPLGINEAIEAIRIASASAKYERDRSGIRRRPYRAPHHTISTVGLVGGGSPPRPGEVTLAHRGVPFLDELPEFRRDSLEALRQPLEDGTVLVTRARHSVRLPCRFMLVAAANPCPCGRGAGDPGCECEPQLVRRYTARLSGALADRIDISLAVGQPSADAMRGPAGESSKLVRERVIAARERQTKRLGECRCNAEATPAEARRLFQFSGEAQVLIAEGYARLGLSGRGYDRVLRVARTLADLAGRERVRADHVQEALWLRRIEET